MDFDDLDAFEPLDPELFDPEPVDELFDELFDEDELSEDEEVAAEDEDESEESPEDLVVVAVDELPEPSVDAATFFFEPWSFL